MKLMDIKNGIGPEWAEKGYQMPQFDIEAVRKKTHEEPVWVHFGGGTCSGRSRRRFYSRRWTPGNMTKVSLLPRALTLRSSTRPMRLTTI